MSSFNQDKLWRLTKELWYAANLPDEKGFYYCSYCGRPQTQLMVTLDHVKQAGRYPDYRYDISNLIPSCSDCNNRRGEQDYDSFILKESRKNEQVL